MYTATRCRYRALCILVSAVAGCDRAKVPSFCGPPPVVCLPVDGNGLLGATETEGSEVSETLERLLGTLLEEEEIRKVKGKHKSKCNNYCQGRHAVADPGFWDGGGAPVWIGGARSDGITVCGRKLKKIGLACPK